MRASNILWLLAVDSVVAFPPFRQIRTREDSIDAAAKEAAVAEEAEVDKVAAHIPEVAAPEEAEEAEVEEVAAHIPEVAEPEAEADIPAEEEAAAPEEEAAAPEEAEAHVPAEEEAAAPEEAEAHVPAEEEAAAPEEEAAHEPAEEEAVEADEEAEAHVPAEKEAAVPEEAAAHEPEEAAAAHPEPAAEQEVAEEKVAEEEIAAAHPEPAAEEIAAAHPEPAAEEIAAAHPEAEAAAAAAPAAEKADVGAAAEAGAECEAICAEREQSAQQSVNYRVQPQDTLSKIAKSLGSGICDIAAANADAIANIDVIFPNQTLTVPVAMAAPDDTSCLTVAAEATCVEGGEGTAVVQAGDAFVTIAAGLGISSDALVAANPDADRFNLQEGQVINVPVCTGAAGEVPAAAAEEVAAAVEKAEAEGELLSNTSSATTKRSMRMRRNRGGSTALFQLTQGGTAN
ncbi:carbohydrate-binding module family 50 protein [Apiospora marii]|uniref:Carbohydrate-binding module family 50 protein n=1 Tax=Apiospora marii TaxID=335849 RepID=A0ABR1RE46_9PEZI